MTDPNTGMARTLVDEWVRAGVRDAALAPGSRSTPLALALAGEPRIRLSVILDERSASFFALGAAKASGRPAVVLCTSGTAAANFHPAVLEAAHSRVPLIVCTADRPPELRGTGANQAVDQARLFGTAVRWFFDLGPPEPFPAAGRYWRSVAARAWAVAMGPPAGPVHLNLPFREPLVPTGASADVPEARPGGDSWLASTARRPPAHPTDVAVLAEAVTAKARGLVVAGWGPGASHEVVEAFAAAAGWPVLADAVSGLRTGPLAVSTYDPLLRSAEFASSWKPELVVHLGAPLTNRSATAWLDESVPRVLVDPDGAWLDPERTASSRIVADPDDLLASVTTLIGRPADEAWRDGWLRADAAARAAIDGRLDAWLRPFEGRVVRDVAAALPDGATLVVGSSMPVRDAESFVAARGGLRWVANRGASGIDGFVSTVLGAASVSDSTAPTVGLLGDLTLLHDAGGLLGAGRRGIDATLVVLDNDGGGVFSFLPQAGHPEHFETLFGTPHGIDLLDVARAYGVPAELATLAHEVAPAVLDAVAAGGVRLVVVPTDRDENVTRHREVWAAVAEAATNWSQQKGHRPLFGDRFARGG